MLITRTPLRISFIGGGTDMPSFYGRSPGAVVSTAINRYIYVSVNKKFDGDFRISYSKTETVDTIDEIKHDLVREALRLHNIKTGLEITSVADIPGNGTGLGSSSTLTVGLVNALSRDVNPATLAERAFTIEAGKCFHPVGKQDQYAAAFGGFNFIVFKKNSVHPHPIRVSEWWLNQFESHFLLLWTGLVRSADEILKDQDKSFRNGGNVEIGKQLANLAHEFKVAICDEVPMEDIGAYISEAWKLKRFFANGISNSKLDLMYEAGIKAGAFGGKLLGAGGGGFLFFIAPPEKHAKIVEKTGLRPVEIKIEKEGSRIIYES